MKKLSFLILSIFLFNILEGQITVPKLIVEETDDITIKLRDSTLGKVKILNGQLQLAKYADSTFNNATPNGFLTLDKEGNVTKSKLEDLSSTQSIFKDTTGNPATNNSTAINYMKGNIGIGTQNPTAKLHVEDGYIFTTADRHARIKVINKTNLGAPHFIGQNLNNQQYLTLDQPIVAFQGRDKDFDTWTTMTMYADGNHTATSKPTRIDFGTIPENRLASAVGLSIKSNQNVIVPNGKLGIGTMTPQHNLVVVGTAQTNDFTVPFLTTSENKFSSFNINSNGGSGNLTMNWNTVGNAQDTLISTGAGYRLAYNAWNTPTTNFSNRIYNSLMFQSRQYGQAGESTIWKHVLGIADEGHVYLHGDHAVTNNYLNLNNVASIYQRNEVARTITSKPESSDLGLEASGSIINIIDRNNTQLNNGSAFIVATNGTFVNDSLIGTDASTVEKIFQVSDNGQLDLFAKVQPTIISKSTAERNRLELVAEEDSNKPQTLLLTSRSDYEDVVLSATNEPNVFHGFLNYSLKNKMLRLHAGINYNANLSTYFLDNGNVGIGTDSPNTKLHVNGRLKANNAHFGATPSSFNEQGAYIGWNRDGRGGKTIFGNNRGLGGGGFEFVNFNLDETIKNTPLVLDGNGKAFFNNTVSALPATSGNELVTLDQLNAATDNASSLKTYNSIASANADSNLASGSKFILAFNDGTGVALMELIKQ